jgi:iron complex transport system ATP-binding protein
MILETSQLSFQYDSDFAIRDLSFSLKKGDFCSLLGPNGSGKTTLLNLLTGLLKGGSGTIKIDQKELKQYPTIELARKVAVVPQRQDFVYDFSVYDTVMMGRNPHQNRWEFANEKDHQIVMDALAKTKLIHLKNRLTNHLSGGEFQRTLIARAIAQQAPIMMLDEPLSNLDIAHKFEIMEILKDINQTQNTTIIIILHDFSFTIQYVPLTLLMDKGTLLYFGATKEVFSGQILYDAFDLKVGFHIDSYGNVFKNI